MKLSYTYCTTAHLAVKLVFIDLTRLCLDWAQLPPGHRAEWKQDWDWTAEASVTTGDTV